MLVWLIHGGHIVVGIEISVSVVRTDVSVNSLAILDFYLRRDLFIVSFVVACTSQLYLRVDFAGIT
jgi:hypothetical protein